MFCLVVYCTMFNDIRQWFLGKKTRKNTSKMFDKGNKEVYNINIKLSQTRKRGAQCLIEKNGIVSMRWNTI